MPRYSSSAMLCAYHIFSSTSSRRASYISKTISSIYPTYGWNDYGSIYSCASCSATSRYAESTSSYFCRIYDILPRIASLFSRSLSTLYALSLSNAARVMSLSGVNSDRYARCFWSLLIESYSYLMGRYSELS